MQIDRDEHRKNAKVFLGISNKVDGELIGYLLDLTTAGMRLKSLHEIKIGAEFEISIDLPVEVNDSNTIVFKTKSKWCNKCKDSRYFETGFEIYDCSRNDKFTLKALLKTYLFSYDPKTLHISLSMMEV